MYSNQPIEESIILNSSSLEEGEIQPDSIDISNQQQDNQSIQNIVQQFEGLNNPNPPSNQRSERRYLDRYDKYTVRFSKLII